MRIVNSSDINAGGRHQAPARRYHLWQTPETRVVAPTPLPKPPRRLPRWLVLPVKTLLGPGIYARCKNAALKALGPR